MHTSLRTLFTTTTAIAAVVVISIVLTLPPATSPVAATLPPTLVMGAYHVHTSRSDGTGDIEAVAAAAARAGLAFVILTDHGDGTAMPAPATYRQGVLCIDAVEVNTGSGHVVALGLEEASPYPLAGSARDVIDDIHRMGGMAVIAHPDSPNQSLRWRGQASSADGIEWLNLDSEWRDERVLPLLGTAVQALLRGPAAVATLITRPTSTLARWDADAARRPMFGLAALDAHANIPWQGGREPRTSRGIRFPSYETLFRTVAQVVRLEAPLSRDAARDAKALLGALKSGHSYSVIRAFADPAPLTFAAASAGQQLEMGDRGAAGEGGTTLSAATSGGPHARLTLLGDNRVLAQGIDSLRYEARGTGVFRVEASLPGHDMPWLFSNPIVLAARAAPAPVASTERADGAVVALSTDTAAWAIERESSSLGAIVQEDGAVRFSFTLGPGVPRGQYAALVHRVPDDIGVRDIRFTARSAQPMRLSVQIRTPDDRGGERWRRSVYLAPVPRRVVIPLEEFEPADRPTTRRPVVAPVQTLLFVVDTLNAKPSTAGTLWISDVAVGTPSVTSEQ